MNVVATTIVVLPAFNEERSIDSLFPKLLKALQSGGRPFKILVCDDGSIDKTRERLVAFEALGQCEVLSHSINRGLGETIRDLFERASQVAQPHDVIVRLDCDDTHDPKQIEEMIRKIDEGFDVVIASRFVSGGSQSGLNLYRRTLSRSATFFMRSCFPIKGLHEYTSGFRAYRANIIQEAIQIYGNDFIQLKGVGFTCTLEKLVKLRLLGARFAEVPFHLAYDEKKSTSKMASGITTLGYFLLALLYHWPWGGWRKSWPKRIEKHRETLVAPGAD